MNIEHNCDIKGNESDVADIVVEILAKKEVKCFILFSVLVNSSNSLTRHSILMGFTSECSILKLPECGVEIPKLKTFDK